MKRDLSRPGKPTDHAYIESFNGRFQQECLNEHWFISLEDAQQKLDAWRTDCNGARPHSALENRTPEAFAALQASARAQQTGTVPSVPASANLSVASQATAKTDGTPARAVERE